MARVEWPGASDEPLLSVFSGVVFGLSSSGWAQAYPPDGPEIPVITLNEGQEGAAGLPPLEVPTPNGI
jgi:hypothetical protein